MNTAFAEDLDVRRGQIARQIFAAGVGNRAGLNALFMDTRLRARVPEVIKFLDNPNEDVSGEMLTDIEGVFSQLKVRLEKYRSRSPSNSALNSDRLKAYQDTQGMLYEKLRFSDYESFAKFAHVELLDLCLLRGGVFNIPKIETTTKRVNQSLPSFLRDREVAASQLKPNGSGREASNGHHSKQGTVELIVAREAAPIENQVLALGTEPSNNGKAAEKAIAPAVETELLPRSDLAPAPAAKNAAAPEAYVRNQREQALFDRMERLGASRSRSLKRKRFMEASGISQPAMSNFLKGKAASWPRTLERIEAGLNVVEKEFGSLTPYEESADVVALETALEVSTSQPATAKAPVVQEASEIPAGIDNVDQVVQIADLLGVSLEDERFRVCFEETMQALAQLSQGKVEMIELQATSLADKPLRWRLVKGDVESMCST